MLSWPGMDNSVDLRSIRVRWIRQDGRRMPRPAPVKATAEGWAESTTLQTVAPFMYKDVDHHYWHRATLRRVTGNMPTSIIWRSSGGIISDTDGTNGV